MDRFCHVILTVLLTCFPAHVAALELFGVELESTSRDELRDAVKQAGVILIREGGDDEWFDVYDSSPVLGGSSRLYLGFVKQNQQFAFAEYEFSGLDARSILRDLTGKYGAANVRGGRYISDKTYRWQRGEVEIQLLSDWQNYKTRLSYVIPANLASLREEQAAGPTPDPDVPAEPVVSFY